MMHLGLALSRFNLLEYLKRMGADEVQRGEWVIQCPVCRKDKLVVNVEKRVWHCWVCQQFGTYLDSIGGVKRLALRGAGGILDLIQILENCDHDKAIEKVLAETRVTVSELSFIETIDFRDEVVEYIRDCPEISFPEYSHSIDGYLPYLQQRGITATDVLEFGLFYCTGGRYGQRLIFPVFDNGKLIYFQARAMWSPLKDERYIKALNPPRQEGQAVSTELLFHLDRAVVHGCGRVCITEGPIDAIHVGNDAVCSFGKALSYAQIARLLRAGVHSVDLLWDADAHAEMRAIAPLLSSLFHLRLIWLPSADPGSFDRIYLQSLRESSESIRRDALEKIL